MQGVLFMTTDDEIKFDNLKLDLLRYEIEYDDFYDCLYDCLFEVFGYTVLPTKIDNMVELYNIIPKHLRIDAMQWGICDTVVKDEIYLEFKKNKDKIIEFWK